MDESVKDRLLAFIKAKSLSQKRFEQAAGLSNGYINKLRHSPSADKLSHILEAYPDINRIWLLTGEGDMITDKRSASNTSTDTKKHYKSLPLIPIDAMAGQLSGEDFQIMEYDCERYSIPDFDAADFLVTVSGDSMTPTFMSGDILAVRKVETSRLWFQWGKPYVIATRQGCIVKRIMPSEKDGFVEIVSDNKEQYPKYELHSDEIVGVAMVIGLVRRL